MRKNLDELKDIAARLESIAELGSTPSITGILDLILERAKIVGKSWSGSNLGYHASVYYHGLKKPPVDDRFSREWGLQDAFSNGTSDNWVSYDFDEIYDSVVGDVEALKRAENAANEARVSFDSAKSDIESIVRIELSVDDPFLSDELMKVVELKIPSMQKMISRVLHGKQGSYDHAAVLEGIKIAPHQKAFCVASALRANFTYCHELAEIAVRIRKHLLRRYNNADDTKNVQMFAEQNDVQKDMIFIVHGHDESAIDALALFLRELGLKPIVLNDSASLGKTIIEKIEHYSAVAYAVILYTPCDEGRSKQSGELRLRARQNVIFEHGYLIAKLGRNNVAALVDDDVEKPSDTDGIVYIARNNDWKMKLGRELKAAGIQFDANKIFN